jgi:two-component system, NarL family, invasion response regulator UvrY
MQKNSNVNVVIADDHQVLAVGLAAALIQYNITVVGRSEKPSGVLELCNELAPDVVVLDVRFPEGGSGLEVAKSLITANPAMRIVFFSQFDQPHMVREAYRIGALAFITKDCSPQILAEAIQKAALGERFFLGRISEQLAALSVHDSAPQALLDKRELEIFKRIAAGEELAHIAADCDLSIRTVARLSVTIKQKLGIHKPAELTRLAIKHQILEP